MIRSRLRDQKDERWHVLVVHAEGEAKAYTLDAATYSIGRDPSNSVVLNHDLISRQHAILMRIPAGNGYTYQIMDGNLVGEPSRNGITVNGQKCLTHDLEDGDQILFPGQIKAEYYLRDQLDDSIRPLPLRSIKTESPAGDHTTIMTEEES